MPLIVKRKLHETWRDATADRCSNDAEACLAEFDATVAAGLSEAEAAFRALEARGLLWSADEPGPTVPAPSRPDEVPSV